MAIPTAIPDDPLTNKFGILVGRTSGSVKESSKFAEKSTVSLSKSESNSSAAFLILLLYISWLQDYPHQLSQNFLVHQQEDILKTNVVPSLP